jgi:hypothetical protein
MKILKLLTAPAVLLVGLAFAAPASAHELTNVTVAVTCQTTTGKVCVEVKGNIPASGNDARNLFLDLFANGSNTSLGEIEFKLPASNGSTQQFDQTLCFNAVNSNASGFTVKAVKVTDSSGNSSDLRIQIGSTTITFPLGKYQAPPTVGETGSCQAMQSPTPTPSPNGTPTPTPTAPTPTATSGGNGAGSPTPTASANTTAALAETGGFDFRFPLIGLVLLVAGGALFVISASRGRSAQTK